MSTMYLVKMKVPKTGIFIENSRQIWVQNQSTFLRRSFSAVNLIHSVKEDDDGSSSKSNLSARKQFQQIPVHPSIIEYIKSIGIGIPPRDTFGKKRLRYSSKFSDEQRGHRLRPRGRPLNSRQKSQFAQTEEDESQKSNDPKQVHLKAWSWMPPPPFGPKSLPVELIGSVGPEEVIDSNSLPPDSTVETSPDTFVKPRNYSFPKNQSLIPEIALAGRSNVGKSTLLNALLYGNRDENRVIRSQHKKRGHVPINMKLPKGIKAVTSDKPGETRRVSFYKLQHVEEKPAEQNDSLSTKENRRLLLVDLPGYGFAFAKEKHALAFRTLMCDYLLHRGKALKRVLILIDARHGMKRADIEFLAMLEQQNNAIQATKSSSKKSHTLPFPIQLVLTKCDLVTQADLARRVTQVRQQLSEAIRREAGQLPVMLVSARAGVGFNNVHHFHLKARGGVLELQKELAALAQPRITQSKINSNVKQVLQVAAKNV